MKSMVRTVLVHSSSSIKGDEQSAVVLYKFASNPEARTNLSSMLLDFDEIQPVSADEKIAVDYAFSRLYVAVTRASIMCSLLRTKTALISGRM